MNELHYATTLGYEISILECLAYKEKRALFKDFLTVLSNFKLRYMGISANVTDVDSELQMINDLSHYTGSLALKPEMIQNNRSLATYFKWTSNSCLVSPCPIKIER